jgi:hypothetical protein
MMRVAIRSLALGLPRPVCQPLRALGRDLPGIGSRFRRWRGACGRDYLVSVYELRQCPDYVDAVLIAVDRDGQCLAIGEVGADRRQLFAFLATARAAGATHVHVHLLADGPAGRAAVIDDLEGRCAPDQ